MLNWTRDHWSLSFSHSEQPMCGVWRQTHLSFNKWLMLVPLSKIGDSTLYVEEAHVQSTPVRLTCYGHQECSSLTDAGQKTRALLRLERTMNLLEEGRGREGGGERVWRGRREGGERGWGRWGREGGWGGWEGGEGCSGGEGRGGEGWRLYIL